MQKRILSIVLSLSIIASLFAGLSFNAFAATADSKDNTVISGYVGANNTGYTNGKDWIGNKFTPINMHPKYSLIRDTADTDAKVYYYVSSTETNVASSYAISSTSYSTVYDERQLLPKGDGVAALTGVEYLAFNDTNGETVPTIKSTSSTGLRQIIPTKLARSMFVTTDESGNFTGLVDDESKQYVQINFKLDAEATIDSFITTDSLNRSASYSKYRNTYGHFKVYVADTEDGLWDEANCVSEVTNDTVDDQHEYIGVNLTTPKKGSWVGLRIIKAYASLEKVQQCTSSNLQMRVAHFGVHGTYVNAAAEGTVVTATADDAVADVEGIEVSEPVIAHSNRADKSGNKAGTATLTATEKVTTGGYDYTFKGWYKGEETEPTSTDATFVYDLANGNADFVAKYDVTEEVVYHTVTVKFGKGFTYQVKHGEAFDRDAAKAEIEAYYPASFPDGVRLYIRKGNSDNVTEDMTLNTYSEYRTRFYGMDGEKITEDWIGAGSAVTAPEVPEVEGKVFTGWDKEIVAANAPADYYALFEETAITHTVTVKYGSNVFGTFEIEDGQAFDRDAAAAQIAIDRQFEDGVGLWIQAGGNDLSNITADINLNCYYIYRARFYDINGELKKEHTPNNNVPVAPKDDEMQVEGKNFIGWTPAVGTLSKPTDFYPVYEDIKFNVTFIGFDGVVLDTQEVIYGEPAIDPVIPEVPDYAFARWDTDFSEVKSDLTVTAIYDCTIVYHTVTVKVFNSKVLGTFQVRDGEAFDRDDAIAQIIANNPEIFTEGVRLYIQKGNNNLDNVTTDLTLNSYYEYKVTFYGENDEVVADDWIAYGSAVVAPEAPEVEGKNFIGWTPDVVATATAPATYTALYEVKAVTYNVVFKDAKGDIITIAVEEGKLISDYIDVNSLEVREVYGYTVYKEDGCVVWNQPIGQPIYGDLTVEAKYHRDAALNCKVTVYNLDGTSVLWSKVMGYDEAIELKLDSANSWVDAEGNVLLASATGTLYAIGSEMNIYASADAAQVAPVAIVGKTVTDNSFSVFAHSNRADIKAFGIIFASNTYYKVDGGEMTVKAVDDVNNPKKIQKTEASADGKVDFMATLNSPIGTNKYAVAYVILNDGNDTVIYSAVVAAINKGGCK